MHKNGLSLFELQEWLIDVNIAIISDQLLHLKE